MLDDFFGDGKTAEPECSFCGGKDGELIVSIQDANGPTHWYHKTCKHEADARHAAEVAERNAATERNIHIANTDK